MSPGGWSGIMARAWERYEHRDDFRQIGPGLFIGKLGANPLRLPSPGDTCLTRGAVRVLVCPPNDLIIR